MKKAEPRPVASSAPAGPVAGPRIGRIVGLEPGGRARVEFAGGQGPLPARCPAELSPSALAAAAREGREALLLFEEGDPRRPIVVSLLASSTPHLDRALQASLPEGARDARVDGRRVEIEGREEVVLRCGKASLTLRRDGSVELRGVRIKTAATQVQRIRGGKVQIN